MSRMSFFLCVLTCSVGVWSAISPHDRFTWWLEIIPALVYAAVLCATYRIFPLTDFLYALIAAHCVLLFVGGHYTYAEVPLFNWLRDEYHLARNYYDRVGHFMQGFVPAMIGRELLLRTSPLKPGKWMVAILVLGCLGISAGYELIEWKISIYTGEGADAFLGTQGDIWDTQEDMFMALVGAITALISLAKIHDRALARIGKRDAI